MGTSTPQVNANRFASMCFGDPSSGKADPETTTKHDCNCKGQCRSDVTRKFAEEDWCNTEGGLFTQCGEGMWPFKYDWCRCLELV